MAAAQSVLKSGDPSELEQFLVGRRIWVQIPRSERMGADGHKYTIPEHLYDIRVLSFKGFFPADPSEGRPKHLVQLWTDPGGMRTLSLGSIHLRDPNKVKAGKAAAAARASKR